MRPPVRVLVVDDSAFMRKIIPKLLGASDSIEVVGTAVDGRFGLKKIEELRPQVVTLDLEMPGLSGLETLEQIQSRYGIPVIVVSAHSTEGATQTLRALSLGAFDFVAKPSDVARQMPAIAEELIAKVNAAAHARHIAAAPEPRPVSKTFPAAAKGRPTRVVAIGVSTGGPQALQSLLPQLPATFPGTILIVQHMPEGFTEKFARRMDDISSIRVKEAQSGDLLRAGCALICPGNRHLKVKRLFSEEVAVLSDEPHVNGHRPSADVLFRSVAEECGTRSIAVLMTGMGDDGARSMANIKAAGGLTLAQSEESCVVYGMPKAAIERGHVARVVELRNLASTLLAECAVESGNDAVPRYSSTGLAAGSGRT